MNRFVCVNLWFSLCLVSGFTTTLVELGLVCLCVCICLYSIIGSGTEYRISGKVVSSQEYQGRLESLSILIKAKNFLVFQVAMVTYFILSHFFCCKQPRPVSVLLL